jgi:hypothetical protein
MFVTDRGECKKTGHDVNTILQSDQYNRNYPGLLRNFVNDYYFDEIVNWTLDGQKNYEELINIIKQSEHEIIDINMFRYVTTNVDYIWVTDNNEITIILEIGKRNICYLKNIVKLTNEQTFPELFITVTNIYSRLLLPLYICKKEIIASRLGHVDDFCGCSYSSTIYGAIEYYIFRFNNGKAEKIGNSKSKNSIVVLFKNVDEYQKTRCKFRVVRNLLMYSNITKGNNEKLY